MARWRTFWFFIVYVVYVLVCYLLFLKCPAI